MKRPVLDPVEVSSASFALLTLSVVFAVSGDWTTAKYCAAVGALLALLAVWLLRGTI